MAVWRLNARLGAISVALLELGLSTGIVGLGLFGRWRRGDRGFLGPDAVEVVS